VLEMISFINFQPLLIFSILLLQFVQGQLVQLVWESHQPPAKSSDQKTGISVVSGSNREIVVDLYPTIDFRHARLDFYTEDGTLGCSVVDFIERPTQPGDWVASGHFLKSAPKDTTYYAQLTMHDKQGNVYNISSKDLQNIYFPGSFARSNYAITYVQDQKTLDNRPPIKLTSFKVVESEVIFNQTDKITIESSFESPIGVRTSDIYICSDGVNICESDNVLCYGKYPYSFPGYANQESTQIGGNWTAGTYRTECYINKISEKPRTYYMGIRLVDNGGRETDWGPEILSKLGFQSTIDVVKA